MASRACDLGRVTSNGVVAKPAREVRTGDMLLVKTAGGDYEVEVLGVSEMRGPAAIAQTLFRETEQSKELRAKAAEERKTMPRFDTFRTGRPSKRDRRDLDRLRGDL